MADLPLEEGLEGLIRSAYNPQQLDSCCSPGLNLGVAEVVVDIDIGLILEQRYGRLVNRDIGDDQGLEYLVHVFQEEGLHIRPVHETLEELQAV